MFTRHDNSIEIQLYIFNYAIFILLEKQKQKCCRYLLSNYYFLMYIFVTFNNKLLKYQLNNYIWFLTELVSEKIHIIDLLFFFSMLYYYLCKKKKSKKTKINVLVNVNRAHPKFYPLTTFYLFNSFKEYTIILLYKIFVFFKLNERITKSKQNVIIILLKSNIQYKGIKSIIFFLVIFKNVKICFLGENIHTIIYYIIVLPFLSLLLLFLFFLNKSITVK